MDTYYAPKDLERFAEMGRNCPDLCRGFHSQSPPRSAVSVLKTPFVQADFVAPLLLLVEVRHREHDRE